VAKFAPLALGFDLDIDSSTSTSTCRLPAPNPEASAPRRTSWTFSALKGHDVHGRLRIGALQASKLKLAKLNAKIRLAGGRLDVSPLSGESLRRHGQRQPVAQRQRQPARRSSRTSPGSASIR
jgi:AsmA protein